MKKSLLTLVSLILTGLCFAQQPIINSFAPTSGAAGTPVIITGNNFSTIAANNIVFFGAVKATVTAASVTSLTVTVPFGATYQPITVTTNGLTAYSSKPFIQIFTGGVTIGTGSFEPRFDTATDIHPTTVAAADFDGDGRADIATSNNYSTANAASVSILRNTSSVGAISFASKLDLPTTAYAYAISVADINGDGKPDLVYSNIVNSTITILKNTSAVGNISFAAGIDLPAVSGVHSIAIHDLDADGKPDIAFVSYISNTVSVYRNTGSGGSISFATRLDLVASSGPRCIAIGDLDADGKPDMAVSNEFSNSVSAFRNTSTPGSVSFAPKQDFTAGASPFSVAIGDLNNDGKSDMVVGNNASVNFSTFKNTSVVGSISFGAKVDFSGGSTQYLVSIGDVNGDGKPDIVMPSLNTTVSENTSSASTISFGAPVSLSLIASPFSIAIADLDGDGKDDLTGAIFTQNWVSVLRNRNNEPLVSFFLPSTGTNGTVVSISGGNFTGALGVKFGGTPASSFTVLSGTSISAVVGTGATGAVEVTNQYGTGKRDGFTYIGAPVISSFTPTSAGIGATITITGNYFSGATAVSFGGVPANSFNVVSATTITAVVANGATGNVSVTTAYGTADLAGFTYVSLPVINSFTPTSGTTGTVVTITGSNLSTTSAVRFSSFAASSFTAVSDNTVTAVVGNGGSGFVHITTVAGMDSLAGFTFIPPPPPITSISPTAATAGTVISISGNFFTGATAVSFGGNPAASFTVVSPTQINAVVGAAGSGNVTVTTPSGTGSIAGFTLIPTVTISSFTPASGFIGSTVTITGTNFSTTAANNIVYFGLVKATVISATTTQLVVTVPPGAAFKPITVNLNNQVASSVVPFLPTFSGAGGNILPTTFSNAGTFTLGNSGWTYNNEDGCVGDIDRDGKLDIVMGYSDLAAIGVFRNISSAGNIQLGPKQDFFPGLASNGKIHLADMNNDGWLDLVWGTGNSVRIAKNISTVGSINFDPVRVFGLNINNIKYIEDIDGDARLDMIGIKQDASTIAVFRNTTVNGILSFEPLENFSTGVLSPWTVILADLDGDNKPELLSAGYNDGNISVSRNISVRGKVIFATPVLFPFTPGWHSFKSGDMDGDGKTDLALSSLGGVSVLRNTSTGPGNFSFAAANNFPIIGTWNVEVADLNGDNKLDIAADNGLGPNVSLFQNTSTPGNISLLPNVNYVVNSGYDIRSTPLGDIDGDGKTDFVTINPPAGTFNIFRNTAGEDFAHAGPDTAICYGTSVQIGTAAIAGYTYSWTSSPAGFTSTVASPVVNPLITTTYYLSVTNNNAMTARDTVIVTVLQLPVANAGPDQTICSGSSVQLLGTGGTIYQWTPTVGLNNPNIANPIATPPATTAYILKVSNGSTCVAYDTVLITVVPAAAPTVAINTASTTVCAGTAVTFTATATNGGTTPAYQWQVNGVNAGNNSNTFTTSTLTNNAQVKVIVTSSLACAVPATATSNVITMTVTAIPNANAGNDVNICTGSSTQLQASGGTTYSWSPVAGLNNPNIANPIASPAATTTYTVTVSNGINCTASDAVVVSVGPPATPAVSINTTNNNICLGSAATFNAVATNGGSNPAFQWKVNGINAGTNSNTFTNALLANNDQVTVIITSSSACITSPTATSNTITMQVQQLATPVVTVTNQLLTVSNPEAGASYTWQIFNGSFWGDVIPAATGTSYTAPASGTYRVKAVKGPCTTYSVSAITNIAPPFSHFIYIHPNPTNQFVTFDSIALSKKYESLEIIDMEGKRVMPLIDIKNQWSITVDINLLRKGIYMAIFRTWQDTFTALKFIKQ